MPTGSIRLLYMFDGQTLFDECTAFHGEHELVHSADHPLQTPPDFRFADFFVYRRPFLTEFLNAVSQWFNLAVWSSARHS
jgi:TFIIF-interacting CTD phosphatase-like protein